MPVSLFISVFGGLAILPSVVLTSLSVLAFRGNKKFWYYNLSFASCCNGLFLAWFILSFYYSPRRLDAQEGLVLLTLPIWGVIFIVGGFLLGLLIYLFVNYENSLWRDKPLPSYPFWISVASIIGFGLAFWLLPVFIRPFYFVYE